MKLTKQQAQQVLQYRNNLQLNKVQEFYDWLNVNFCDYGKPTKKGTYVFPIICYNPKLTCFEMWNFGDIIIKNFESKTPNTRTKVNSETCLEIDKLPQEKAFAVICEVISSLMRNKYNFFVWYAKGQRSPHIRIYDFEEMQEFNPKQRVQAQVKFWRKHIPFGCFQYVDTGIFVDEHPLQLEYAIHWKYGTQFELLFEYKPEVENAKIRN